MSFEKKPLPESKPDTEVKSKPEIPSSVLEAAIKAVADQMIPAAVAAAVAATSRGQYVQSAAPSRPLPPSNDRCPTCSQLTSACRDEHVEMIVYPTRYEEHAQFFPGAIINGVKYLSNDASHRVPVPKVSEAAVLEIVRNFENNEQDTRLGRKAERRSGVVTPHGAQFSPANQAWR